MNELKQKQYMEGILRKNEEINLTAITDPEEFWVKHVIDSLIGLSLEEYKSAKRVIDVGTGAGFPGMPLAIESPEKEFVLLDSLKKRLNIIDDFARELEVKNVATVHGRAEDVARDANYRETFDICISRAVANLATLSEYCLPFVKVGGYFVAYKGPEASDEIAQAKKAIATLGGKVVEIRDAKMEEYGISHNLVIIKKVDATPKKYPRKAGVPSKTPIR